MTPIPPVALLGTLVVVTAWVMAGVANAKSAGSPAVRRLALLLFIMGADVATSGIGLLRVYLNGADHDAIQVIHWMLDTPVPPLTVLFMASALDTPIARALRRPWTERALALLSLAGPVAVFVAVRRAPSDLIAPTLYAYLALGFLLGFLLALHGWRAASGAERRRAGMFAFAFGVLDISWGLAFGLSSLRRFAGGASIFPTFAALYGIGALVFTLVLGYAILQHRLVDLDVKVRFAISKSTLAAIFVAVFFVGSEAAQQFFGATFQSAWVGIAAAGMLVFAIAPLQRAAERIAERAVPIASPSPAPSPEPSPSKEQGYRSALRAALRDRTLTREEEIGLAHLSDELGISHKRAREIWHDVEREGERERWREGGAR